MPSCLIADATPHVAARALRPTARGSTDSPHHHRHPRGGASEVDTYSHNIEGAPPPSTYVALSLGVLNLRTRRCRPAALDGYPSEQEPRDPNDRPAGTIPEPGEIREPRVGLDRPGPHRLAHCARLVQQEPPQPTEPVPWVVGSGGFRIQSGPGPVLRACCAEPHKSRATEGWPILVTSVIASWWSIALPVGAWRSNSQKAPLTVIGRSSVPKGANRSRRMSRTHTEGRCSRSGHGVPGLGDRKLSIGAFSRVLDRGSAFSRGGLGSGCDRGHRVSLRGWTAGVDAPLAARHAVVPLGGTAAKGAPWEVRPTNCVTTLAGTRR